MNIHFILPHFIYTNITSHIPLFYAELSLYIILFGLTLVSLCNDRVIAYLQKYSWNLGQSEEIGNVDELVWYSFILVSVFVGVFINLYFLYIFSIVYVSYTSLLLVVINLLLLLGIYVFVTGFNVIAFVRGVGVATIAIYEYMLDISNLISFILRLNLQLIRLVIILITSFTFYHAFHSFMVFVDYTMYAVLIDYYLMVKEYIDAWVHFLFELGHLAVVFSMQTIAFLVMTLWLFQFLYTTYLYPLQEQ